MKKRKLFFFFGFNFERDRQLLVPRCSRCSPFRLAVRDCGIFRRYCGQTGAPVRGKQSNTPTLSPPPAPITPLTDDVQKWDDPKERRSVKRNYLFFFAGFQLRTDAQMGAGIGSCAHQRVIHAKRPRLSFRAGLAA